jgi:hypothetical protein
MPCTSLVVALIYEPFMGTDLTKRWKPTIGISHDLDGDGTVRSGGRIIREREVNLDLGGEHLWLVSRRHDEELLAIAAAQHESGAAEVVDERSGRRVTWVSGTNELMTQIHDT